MTGVAPAAGAGAAVPGPGDAGAGAGAGAGVRLGAAPGWTAPAASTSATSGAAITAPSGT